MLKTEAVSIFGSQTKLAEALDITPEAVSQWGEVIPELRAFQIERLSETTNRQEKQLAKSTAA